MANIVILTGRLVRDADIKYTANTQTAIARFNIAIDRGKDREGNEKGADFPSCIAYGKTAENIERYTQKGRKVMVQGSIRTGSYEKDGHTVYTTDIVANRVEFLEWGDRQQDSHQNYSGQQQGTNRPQQSPRLQPLPEEMPDSFAAIDEDVPF